MNDKKITRREFLTSATRYALLSSAVLLFGIRFKKILKNADCPITWNAPLPEQCVECKVKPVCPSVRVKPGSYNSK